MTSHVSGYDTTVGKKPFPWVRAVGIAAAVVTAVLLVIWLVSCSQESSKSKTVTTKETTQTTAPAASAASAPAVAASQIFPPPSASVPGVIKEEKESVVGGACLSADEIKKAVREACEPKKAPAVARAKPKRRTPHVAAVPRWSSTPPVVQAPPPVAKLPPPPPSGRFWGWVHPNATVASKMPCYADRQILGMPVQCSSVEVFPRQGNETEVEWNARVAAKNGIAVGVQTDRGTISGIEFRRVEVK